MGQVLVKDFYDVRGRTITVDCPEGTTLDQARQLLAAASGIDVERQRLYYKGKPLSGLELVDLRVNNYFVLLRLPNLTPPANEEVFADGDLQSGRIDTAFLWDLFEHEGRLSVAQADAILKRAYSILRVQSNLVEVQEPVSIVADVHGQWFDLAELFATAGGLPGIPATQPAGTTVVDQNFLFLGDYVDRGRFSSEVSFFLLALMVNEPDRFTLLRGNHESRSQMRRQSTEREFLDKYSAGTFELLVKTFEALPLAAVATCGPHRIFCVHGGIGPYIQDIREINAVNRFVEPTDDKVVRDLTWSDPVTEEVILRDKPFERSWDLTKLPLTPGPFYYDRFLTKAMFEPNPQRGGYICAYSLQALHVFLKQNNLLTVIRGHEQVNGFEWGRPGPEFDFPSVISTFAAPNYTDRSKNLACVVCCSGGVLTIKEFEWRVHPCYDKNSRKDLAREDFHVLVHYLRPDALRDLTEEQLDASFASLAPFKRREATRQDLWAVLKRNLERVPQLATASPQHLESKADTLAAWFAKVDHFARGQLHEAEHEIDVFSSDDDEDRPYESHWTDWPFPIEGQQQPQAPKAPQVKSSPTMAKRKVVRGNAMDADEERAQLAWAFDLFDADGSGAICAGELKLVLEQLGKAPSQEEVDAIFAKWDADNNRELSFEEFVKLVKDHFDGPERMERALRAAWDVFDANQDGFIDGPELMRVMVRLGHDMNEDDVAAMLSRGDADGNALLSYEEFCTQVLLG